MAVLTTSGRAALAIAVASQQLHLAWGTGDPSWDSSTPSEQISATGLLSEVGRRGLPLIQYVNQDPDGAISLPSGRWGISGTPTNNLYMRFAFDYTDGSTAVIRELGIFIGTQPVNGLPAGQVYFVPAQLANPGTLLAIQHIPKILRSPATRQSFEFVLTL